MATINNILNSINNVLDTKKNDGVILSSYTNLNFSYTADVESDGDIKSKASISITSKNNSYNNFCTVDTFKQNLRQFIVNKVNNKIGFSDNLEKTMEILIYRLILNYIINHSIVVVVPTNYNETSKCITWYQKIVLLNIANTSIIDSINTSNNDIVELNVITHNRNTGLLELCQRGALDKKIDTLDIQTL